MMRLLLQLMVLALVLRLVAFALVAILVVAIIMRPKATLVAVGLLLFWGFIDQTPAAGLALLGLAVLLARRAA